jgi:type I restriction enzyme S subunit
MSAPRYATYKDSGVAWLGKVPIEWNVLPLKAVATCNDEVLSEVTDSDAVIEYVEISGVEAGHGITQTETLTFGSAPSRARRVVKHGDVLISTVRTYLRAIASVSHPAGNLIASTGFAAIRPRRVHPGYLGYLLHCEYLISEVIARSVGISYPAINASDLMGLKGPIPTIAEQQAIATFLDRETAKIDALVEEQRRLIELLKEKRQAVISQSVTKGLNPNVPMKDSGVEWLGQVPAHWEVKSVRYIIDAIGDVDHFMPPSVEEGVPYLMTGDLKDVVSDVCLSDCKQVSYSDYLGLSKRIRTDKGDVVMARYATIGTLMYVDIDVEILVSYSCVTLKPDKSKISGIYLFQYMKSDAFRQGVEHRINTNTQGNVGIKDLQILKIAVPPVDEQAAIAAFLVSEILKIDDLKAQAESAINLLKERRSALISAAVTGKIDVRGLTSPADTATT